MVSYRSFRTQVIKYLFGNFVPNNYPFRNHVISLPLCSVNLNLVTKCQKWLRNDDCVGLSTQVMPYHFGHFVTLFCLFCTHLYLTDGWIIR